ncbi:MAG: oligosaccharide flippase family protein [Ramlibacter sp.]|nr:oligosaccharide flippase family protein [Ramlibacter sp.]
MKSALVASIAARGLAAVLGLLALPVYLRFLGVEAYGVVGLFASLQVIVAFMDFGLPTTLTRQLAMLPREPAGVAQARDFTRTFELAYVGLAALIALVLAAVAPFVATHWVNADTLAPAQISWPLQLAAVSLACGWPANLYTAGLAGLHRQVPLAMSASIFAIARVGLAVLFLWHVPTLESFFLAQVLASLLQSAGTGLQLWRELRLPGHRAIARRELLVQSRGFAGGMTMITIASILLSQMDKLVLSHLLPLSEFGMYSIAAALAAGLYVLVSPVFSVIYPRISALWGAGDQVEVVSLYHASAQFMALLVMPVAAVLACFPREALFILTGDAAISAQAAPLLVLLVVAAACNGIMNIPYALQLAAGWTSLSVWLNIAAVLLMAPATWWAATQYGAAGGAAAWALLNVGYVLLTPQLLHGRLLPAEKWRWYGRDVLAPAAASAGVALLLATIGPAGQESRLLAFLELGLCWALTAAATLACLGRLRPLVAAMIVRKTHA